MKYRGDQDRKELGVITFLSSRDFRNEGNGNEFWGGSWEFGNGNDNDDTKCGSNNCNNDENYKDDSGNFRGIIEGGGRDGRVGASL